MLYYTLPMHSLIFIGLVVSSFVPALAASTSRSIQGRVTQLVAYYGQTGGQDRLETFCDDASIDIFPIGFVNGFTNDPGNNGFLETNFGNQCGGYFGATKTFAACQNLIEDIAYCQSKGKKILISIGGGVSLGKLNSDQDGIDFANQLWQIFGPKACGYTGPRPFGDNVVDGFDFDIEQNGSTGVASLAVTLRSLMDADKTKSYLLTAAPQCPIPDAQLGTALTKARFDYVWVQFYNTAFCSARAHFDSSLGGDINFDYWVSWLKLNSPGTPPQILVGLPASNAAARGYYLAPAEVQILLTTLDSIDLFGGIMLFDAMTSRTNTIGDQDYASLLHSVLDTRGFARTDVVPNNGYPSTCGSSTTTVPSSADAPLVASATFVSTSSTTTLTTIVTSNTAIAVSSMTTSAGISLYITSSIITTLSTANSSPTSSLGGNPYGNPPYSIPSSSTPFNAAAKIIGPAAPSLTSSSSSSSFSSSFSSSSSSCLISTATSMTGPTTDFQTFTLYSLSRTTASSQIITSSPLSLTPSTLSSTPNPSQSPTSSSQSGSPTIQPYKGGRISTAQRLSSTFAICILIFVAASAGSSTIR